MVWLRAYSDTILGDSDHGTITQEAKFAPQPVWKNWCSEKYSCAALTTIRTTIPQSSSLFTALTEPSLVYYYYYYYY
jgi:hypothetical protein